MVAEPPPFYQQLRFWAIAVPCAFTVAMLIFGIVHLITDPNEVRQLNVIYDCTRCRLPVESNASACLMICPGKYHKLF